MYKIIKYDPSIDSLEELEKYCAAAYSANKEFFGTDNEIAIEFLYKREEMDEVLKDKTPDWVIGCTVGGIVHVFSPKVYEKVSSHNFSDYAMVLAHEITHVYTKILLNSKIGCPKWLFEGIAGIPSGQFKKYLEKKGKIFDFKDLTYTKDWNNAPNYPQSYLFTYFLISKYGKEKIIRLLKFVSGNDISFFPVIFKEQLDDDFDKVSREWLASREK